MRKLIKFEDGQLAVVYKNSDIRTKLTDKQAHELSLTIRVIHMTETKEQLWLLSREP